MITIGKNILENLTTGMYSDSKVAYREYIQNACDQIDKAISLGILSEEDGCVDIQIDVDNRYVSIKDNATGVKESEFISNVGDIANSNKEQGKDKGFRGIGRLCGLAYCKTLKFTSSALGEDVASVIIYDAEKMRKMLRENIKYTIDEILNAIMKFETVKEDLNEHYFLVELIEINKENTDILSDRKVIEYLSFVAPVPYKREFLLCDQIYTYAENIGYHIDEYNIYVNGEQVHKEYTSKLKKLVGNNLENYDELFRLEFKEFYGESGKLIAWMWVGISNFEIQIPAINLMRGIRLRQSNIQLGGEEVFKEFFREARSYQYFVGEVFSVDKDLIANSQRDYFNENEQRILFENSVRDYCHSVLRRLYNISNDIKNAYKKQADYTNKLQEYKEKSEKQEFIDKDDVLRVELVIKEAEKKSKEAEKKLNNITKSTAISDEAKIILEEVKERIRRKYAPKDKPKSVDIEQKNVVKKSSGYAVDALSKLNKNERKLVSKIWSIITTNTNKDVAEMLIEKIKEEFR